MNGFELRQRNRNQKAKLRMELKSFESTLNAVGVQKFFEDAYIQIYGKEPKLVYKSGWFHLQGKRVSREKLLQKARVLWAEVNEREIHNDEPCS